MELGEPVEARLVTSTSYRVPYTHSRRLCCPWMECGVTIVSLVPMLADVLLVGVLHTRVPGTCPTSPLLHPLFSPDDYCTEYRAPRESITKNLRSTDSGTRNPVTWGPQSPQALAPWRNVCRLCRLYILKPPG